MGPHAREHAQGPAQGNAQGNAKGNAKGRPQGRATGHARGRHDGPAPRRRREGFLLAEVLVALVLLGVGVSGALLLMIHASRAMHRADQVARSAPFVAGLAEAGPWVSDGTAEEGGPGSPAQVDWWWQEGGLEVHHRLSGAGGRVGRRIPIRWLEGGDFPGAPEP